MSRPLTRRFSSFLDRFEERLDLDCERLKRQLIVQVDQQFGVIREKVTELRSRFGGGSRNDCDSSRTQLHLDDPPVENVSLDKWILERNAAAAESRNAASTSSGGKRKSTSSNSQSARKRQKTQGAATTAESNKHVCKYPGCGKTFQRDAHLAMHERTHLGIKPFSCSWPDCRFSADQRSNVVTHVRMSHFKLPQTLSQQRRLNIEDNRNAYEFVQVDNDLLQRRLE